MFGDSEEVTRLRQELAAERLRVSELTKAVIALSDKVAFRALYPAEKREEVVAKADPTKILTGDPRRGTYKAPLTPAEVAEAMARKEEAGLL